MPLARAGSAWSWLPSDSVSRRAASWPPAPFACVPLEGTRVEGKTVRRIDIPKGIEDGSLQHKGLERPERCWYGERE